MYTIIPKLKMKEYIKKINQYTGDCGRPTIKPYQYAMQLIYFPILIFSLSVLTFSCEKKSNWNLKSSQEQFLIVDCILTNEFKNQSLNLSLSVIELNDIPEAVSDVYVSVFDGNEIYNFIEDTIKPGTYASDIKFTGVINKTYTLNIEYNEKKYTAEANMYPVSISDPLPYMQVQDTNLYYIASEIADFNPNESAMYEVKLDWSEVPGYENLPLNETSAHMFFYNLTTIDVNQIFAPTHEVVLFPHGSIMIQRKYSLSPQHEEFIRSLLMETQWHGGSFDIEEGNVYSNLSEGALGFFGACSVLSDTSIVL